MAEFVSPVMAENLAVLLKGGRYFDIYMAGWTAVKVAGGGTTDECTDNAVNTSVTTSSSALLRMYPYYLGKFGANPSYCDWAKKLYLIFQYARYISDAEAVGRVQLKQSNAIGALAAKGIGLRADNFALVGESYGSALGEVDLGVTLTTVQMVEVAIIHSPATPKIEWWVDVDGAGFVLKGTQSTSTKVPQAVGAGANWVMHSIANGGTGGVDASSTFHNLKIWQAR